MHVFFALAILAVSPALTAYAAAQPYDLNYQCSLVEQIKEFRERKAGKLLDVRRKDFLLGLTMVSSEGNDIVFLSHLMEPEKCKLTNVSDTENQYHASRKVMFLPMD